MSNLLQEIEARIAGAKTTTVKQNVGVVREIGDGMAKVEGLTDAMYNEMLDFGNGITGLVLNLEETEVGAIILGDYTSVKQGQEVRTTGKVLQVPVGMGLLGRVVNTLGQPVDGKGPIHADKAYPVEKIAPGIIRRKSVSQPVQTGIMAIDAMIPIGQAVNYAAAVGRVVRQPEVRAEFESLPERHFDQKLLDLLEPAAQATWYAYVFLQDATALHSAAKLPEDLLAEAATVKQRMIRVIEYNLDDQPDAVAKLDAIRPGTSHIDTADDLMRLATMYGQYAAALAADTKHYKAEDAANAKRLAHAINRILGDGRDDLGYWADYQARRWTLLVTTDEEVATIGRWLFRHENGEARFPSLYAVGRQRRRNRDGESELPGEGDELPGEGDIEEPGAPAA